MKKRGQITIFIIVAIVIVALAVLVYVFYPDIKTNLGFGSKNPSGFMTNCLEDDLKKTVERVSIQGGSVNPENYFMYSDEKLDYLCYVEGYYETCVVQKPLLKRHIENEIKEDLKDEAAACLKELEKSYEAKGYNVGIGRGEMDVELLPNVVAINFNTSLVLTKDSSERYDSVRVLLRNNIYELVGIAESIVGWETHYGDAETTVYMDYNHNLKVEKYKQTDGTTVYILTDRTTGDKFQFASRSIVWPPGYGVDGVYNEN